METQELVLVNERDEPVGTMDKMEVHRQGLLHRAFSVFIFNRHGEMLLQQRADGKYHSPGLWTNACCSHPHPGENNATGASRRLKQELGFDTPLEELFSFTYRAQFENGLIEHEYDHVFAGIYEGILAPDEQEVKATAYRKLEDIDADLLKAPQTYTPWFRIAYPQIRQWAIDRFGISLAPSMPR